MNIVVDWDNEQKTIIRYFFSKGWNWDELREAFAQAYQLLETVDHRVNILMDFTTSSIFAPNGAINKARHVIDNPKHSNVGITILVGSRFVSSIFQLMNRLLGATTSKWDVSFVNTIDEAYKVIQNYEQDKDAKK